MRLVRTSVDLLNPEERQVKRHLFNAVQFVSGSLEFKQACKNWSLFHFVTELNVVQPYQICASSMADSLRNPF